MAANQKQIAQDSPARILFAVVAGFFFFIATTKFGTPVVLDYKILPPENGWGTVFESWKIKWGYLLMAPLIISGVAAIPWKKVDWKWPLVLPLAWLVWQGVSTTTSVDPHMSALTLKYFAGCVVLFYLGYFSLGGMENPWPVWTGLALALCWMIHTGFDQHFGGLEATRRLVSQMYNNQLPSDLENNPSYQARLASSRIFATFTSADSFAAAIELLLPATLVFLWVLTPKVRPAMRWVFIIILGGCGLACTYWTGSKAGWLVTMAMGLVAVWHSRRPTKWPQKLGIWLLVIGSVVGAAKLRDSLSAHGTSQPISLKKGQVSVQTRLAYWRGALKILATHPITGSGPGTFATAYPKVARPGDDYTHLVHNDYLEQASDSGIPGLVLYMGMVAGFLVWIYRSYVKANRQITIHFAVWLGLLGLCVHCLVDYHLYIPSLGWPTFFLLGYLMNFKR